MRRLPIRSLALVSVMALVGLILNATPSAAANISCATYLPLPQCEVGNQPIAAVSSSSDPFAYAVTSTGSVYGSFEVWPGMNGRPLSAPIVGIATATLPNDAYPYWLVSSDGGVFAFAGQPPFPGVVGAPPAPGARFFGSMGGTHLNAPVVGIAATPDGGGYWLVAADGGVFAFGDARFLGSMGGTHLNSPIVGIAATPDGGGYWLVAADGGVFAFGDARFLGSMGGTHLNSPIVGIVATSDGGGYVLAGEDGGLFDFGDAPFMGSALGLVNPPIIGVSYSADSSVVSVTTSSAMTLDLDQ